MSHQNEAHTNIQDMIKDATSPWYQNLIARMMQNAASFDLLMKEMKHDQELKKHDQELKKEIQELKKEIQELSNALRR
jgi:hypothetical protein